MPFRHPLLLACMTIALCGAVEAATPTDALVEQGRLLYDEGRFADGTPLKGISAGGLVVVGDKAACTLCHRPSGMGSVEGDIQVRPITGNYLYNIGHKNMATMDPHVGKRMSQSHEPYTDELLARAIHDGINSEGKDMNLLMPKYPLGDADMKALVAYLKQINHTWSPGVTAKTIRFATVVTPDVDPSRRKVFLDMIEAAVAQKNGSTAPGHRHMVSPAEMLGVTERTWKLDVWELKGDASTWGAQLDAYYKAEPVFAILSGLSSGTWAPVAEFCERNKVPDWFPSVDLAPEPGRYTLYFSRGVATEAKVLANYLGTMDEDKGVRRVVQVFRDNVVGDGAADTLKQELRNSGVQVVDRILQTPDGSGLAALVRDVDEKQDILMLWLSPRDLADLDKVAPPSSSRVYLSALLARGEHVPLPAAWKAVARLVYPYQLPDKRDANMNTFRTWMDVRKFPMVDEAMQDELFFSLTYMTMTISEMLDNLYRDYLIERAENMLSLQETTRSQDETRMRAVVGRSGAMIEHYGPQTSPPGILRQTLNRVTGVKNVQTGTSIYPSLSLGAGQRFASKGAYIVRFADGKADTLVSESDWIVP